VQAQQFVEDLKKRQQDTERVRQELEQQFVCIHTVQSDLECLDHAQEYMRQFAEVEEYSQAVRDIAILLQQQQQQHQQIQLQQSQPQPESNDTVQPAHEEQKQTFLQPDFSKLGHMCHALQGVLSSFATQSATGDLRRMLATRMRHLFLTFKPDLLEIVHALLKAAGWPQPSKTTSAALTSGLRCTLLAQRIELELNDASTEVVMCGPKSLLGVLMKPIALRFRFHFSDKQASNRVDKPEWMTAFLLQVVQDHSAFILEVKHIVLRRLGVCAFV